MPVPNLRALAALAKKASILIPNGSVSRTRSSSKDCFSSSFYLISSLSVYYLLLLDFCV